MTELLRFDDPCVVFALKREARDFRREFRPHQRFPGAPCWARFCGPAWLTVLALVSGVGEACTCKTIHWLLGGPLLGNVPYRPKVVLMAGFAGALQEGYQLGDVILATEVIEATTGNCYPVSWPLNLGKGEWDPPLHRGRVLTCSKVVGSTEEKRQLGAAHDAVAVDMETAALAKLCHQQGVPFGCVRVISDDVNTPLSPRLAALLAGGQPSALRVLAALARSLRLAGELWRLARQTRLAAARLGQALGELLTLTLPWAQDPEPG